MTILTVDALLLKRVNLKTLLDHAATIALEVGWLVWSVNRFAGEARVFVVVGVTGVFYAHPLLFTEFFAKPVYYYFQRQVSEGTQTKAMHELKAPASAPKGSEAAKDVGASKESAPLNPDKVASKPESAPSQAGKGAKRKRE